jgi:hypothetical protein
MTTFRIVGERPVAGKTPGETVEGEDLANCDIAALIEGGHLAPIHQRADKAETTEKE